MSTNQCDIGLIGLAVMGENLVLNMESKGFTVAVFNRTTEVTEKFAASRAKGKNIQPTRTIEEFVGALKKPRKAMIMIKAGTPVDPVIGELVPLLEKGDVIIDGGNSLFTDTQRRCKDLEGKGIHFVGCGVSGGEEGALKGPSLMPGGSRESWEIIAPIFRKIAAQVDGEPCCRYMGPDGAGHYVKMVHNGIEYGDMQLICEAYAILKDVVGMDDRRARRHFHRMEQRRARQLSDRHHLADFSQERSRHRQAAGRCDSRQGRPERHRHVDVAIRHRAIGRHLDDQRRGRSARHFFAQRRTRRRVENSAAAEAKEIHRRPQDS